MHFYALAHKIHTPTTHRFATKDFSFHFTLTYIFFLYCRSLSADPYFGFQPYYDQFYMEPIDVPGNLN